MVLGQGLPNHNLWQGNRINSDETSANATLAYSIHSADSFISVGRERELGRIELPCLNAIYNFLRVSLDEHI